MVIVASVAEWVTVGIALAGVLLGALALLVAFRTLRHAAGQLYSARRAIEAGVAAEVRQLNRACRAERVRFIQAFPLHVDLLTTHPPQTWEIWVDGVRLERHWEDEVIWLLQRGSHPTVRTWQNVGELTDEQISDATAVVGFLNDLAKCSRTARQGTSSFSSITR